MAVARSAAWLPSVVGGRTGGGAHLAGHRDLRVRVEGVLHPGRPVRPGIHSANGVVPALRLQRTGSGRRRQRRRAAAAAAAAAYSGSARPRAARWRRPCAVDAPPCARPSPSHRSWPTVSAVPCRTCSRRTCTPCSGSSPSRPCTRRRTSRPWCRPARRSRTAPERHLRKARGARPQPAWTRCPPRRASRYGCALHAHVTRSAYLAGAARAFSI